MLFVIGGLCSLSFFIFLAMSIHSAVKKNGLFRKRILITAFFLAVGIVIGQINSSGYELASNKAEEVNLIILFILTCLLALSIYLVRKRVNKQKKLGAHTSYTCVLLYGIPQVPEIARSSLFITKEKLIIEWKHLKFELPIINITGAEAASRSALSKRRNLVYWEGVKKGLKLKPWEIVENSTYEIAHKRRRGSYLAIDYKSAEGDIKLIIFQMYKKPKAREAAYKLSQHLRTAEQLNSPNNNIYEL